MARRGRDVDRDSAGRFVQASRRMASALRQASAPARRRDPGQALIELLGFADAVAASQPARAFELLAFPSLPRLVEQRSTAATSTS